MPNVFAFDLETYLIQPARHAPKAVCASWAWGHQRKPTAIDMGHMNPRFGQRDIVHDVLEKALKDFEVITGINLAFDLAVIALEYPDLWPLIWKAYREDRIQDGMISEKLLDIAKGQREWLTLPDGSVIKPQYSLAEIAKRRLGIDLEKDMWRLRYGTLYDIPLHLWEPSARDYSLLDAQSAYDTFVSQVSEPNAQVFLQDAPRQARAGWWLHLMSTWGARVSGPALDALEAYVRSELAKISALLLQYNLVDKKGKRNTKVAAERMVCVRTALNLPIPTTDTGKVKLDEESCIDTGDSALEAYAKYTSFKTVLNKDVTALREAVVANMPVQTVFDSLKATGRTGSSGGKRKKGVDPSAHSFQMQNVRKPFPRPKLANGILGAQPPGVRECFVPREGFWICSIDYGQMELHAWAQVCLDLLGFSDLAKMLNAGVDVHCKLGSMMTGRTYEEVFAARKKEQWAKDARQGAKAGNFGFPGGLGAKAFQAYAKAQWDLILTLEASYALKDLWFLMLSEAKPYFALIGQLADSPDALIRQTRSSRYRGDIGFTDGANGFFQGLAADTAKDAGFLLAEACYIDEKSALFGSRPWNMVHDEFLFEVPIARAHEAAWAANKIMEDTGRRWMPDCPPRSVPALMEAWYKDAEDVYDENGRLTVWRPK